VGDFPGGWVQLESYRQAASLMAHVTHVVRASCVLVLQPAPLGQAGEVVLKPGGQGVRPAAAAAGVQPGLGDLCRG
jgi:hypothetical protein